MFFCYFCYCCYCFAVHCYLFICLIFNIFCENLFDCNWVETSWVAWNSLKLRLNYTASNPFCIFWHAFLCFVCTLPATEFRILFLDFCSALLLVFIFSNWSLPQFIVCLFVQLFIYLFIYLLLLFFVFLNLNFLHWTRHWCVMSISFDCDWISIK